MKYTISYVLHTLTGHGYKSVLASNTKHVYRKGEYMVSLRHDPYDKPADEIYPPSIEIYRNDALIAATYLIKNSSFNRNMIAPPIGIANMLEIIVKDGDLFENIKEYVVDKALENLDAKSEVKS